MTESLPASYRKLLEKNKELTILQSTESIMGWDMETMMPPKAIKLRSQQLSQLSVLDHKMSTNPETGKLLEKITHHPDHDKLCCTEEKHLLDKETLRRTNKTP